MDLLINETIDVAVKDIKIENGFSILDIPQNITMDDVLIYFNYHKSIIVEKDESILLNLNERQRFKTESVTCFSCGEIGHVSRSCPNNSKRNCLFCDTFHESELCKFILCFNCGFLGHHSIKCREQSKNTIKCYKCRSNHDIRECPSKWRIYKLKNTKSKKIIMSCPLCHEDNHFFDDCFLNEEKSTIFSQNYKNLYKTAKK